MTGSGRTMTWDAQNRMVSCALNGATSTFTYGADGLRGSSTVGGVTTSYALDGQNVVREFRGGTVLSTYLTDPTRCFLFRSLDSIHGRGGNMGPGVSVAIGVAVILFGLRVFQLAGLPEPPKWLECWWLPPDMPQRRWIVQYYNRCIACGFSFVGACILAKALAVLFTHAAR